LRKPIADIAIDRKLVQGGPIDLDISVARVVLLEIFKPNGYSLASYLVVILELTLEARIRVE
jgi:hypothetical protein